MADVNISKLENVISTSLCISTICISIRRQADGFEGKQNLHISQHKTFSWPNEAIAACRDSSKCPSWSVEAAESMTLTEDCWGCSSFWLLSCLTKRLKSSYWSHALFPLKQNASSSFKRTILLLLPSPPSVFMLMKMHAKSSGHSVNRTRPTFNSHCEVSQQDIVYYDCIVASKKGLRRVNSSRLLLVYYTDVID